MSDVIARGHFIEQRLVYTACRIGSYFTQCYCITEVGILDEPVRTVGHTHVVFPLDEHAHSVSH